MRRPWEGKTAYFPRALLPPRREKQPAIHADCGLYACVLSAFTGTGTINQNFSAFSLMPGPMVLEMTAERM